MVKCVVKSCNSDTRKQNKKKSDITFHRFPKDKVLRMKWIAALKQPDTELNIWHKICSLHFRAASMYETNKGLRKLIDNAVPSLFLHKSPTASNVASNNSLPLDKTDTPGERKLKNDLIRLQQIAKHRRMRCNALYASKRRLKKIVENLSQIVNALKKQRIINKKQVNILEDRNVSAATLLKKMVHNGKEYTPKLRTFALTLYAYSPKAYSFVRSTFNTCLPHPSRLRKWNQIDDAIPDNLDSD